MDASAGAAERRMIMAKCKYETKNGRCSLKGSYAYRRKCYTEDSCKCHEPQTNADRIRAMSDEELARLIDAFTSYFGVCNKDNSGAACIGCELYRLCSLSEGEAMQWLEQPAAEEYPRERRP